MSFVPLSRINRLKRHFINPWLIAAFSGTFLVALPMLVIFTELFSSGDESWSHIVQNLLPLYITNTIILMLGVALMTFVMGVGTAWLVSMHSFPGRRFLSWALILPIAIPGYINGFTWAGILDYTSPVYVFLRNQFGIDTGAFLFFDILSLPGAIIVMSLSLYPYVYILTRAYFMNESAGMLEASASLGRGPWYSFSRIALPLARPAIVAGVSLVLMEVLNDYGLVHYYGVETFTSGIFTAWFAFGSHSASMKLSVYLMIFVLMLISLERIQRGQMKYDIIGSSYRPIRRRSFDKLTGKAVGFICSLPFLFGFLFPFMMLIYWGSLTASMVLDTRFWELLLNSFALASIAAALVVSGSIFISFTVRSFPLRLVKFLSRIATLGYALPGAVIAIGIMVPFLWIDQQIIRGFPAVTSFILTGTWFALLYAYTVRFMAVGYNSIDSGMSRISGNLDEAASSLGKSKIKTLWQINIPLLKGSLIGGTLLVFIDVLKELPLTLILRPFNFDTLAIKAYEYAGDERVAEAAPAALIIILVGTLPVFLLNKLTEKGTI